MDKTLWEWRTMIEQNYSIKMLLIVAMLIRQERNINSIRVWTKLDKQVEKLNYVNCQYFVALDGFLHAIGNRLVA